MVTPRSAYQNRRKDWKNAGSESSINGAVPIATEFKLGNVSKDGLRIDMDAHGFLLRGQIDRVDQILNWKGNANAGMVPLDIDLGSEIPAKRLIIIRSKNK